MLSANSPYGVADNMARSFSRPAWTAVWGYPEARSQATHMSRYIASCENGRMNDTSRSADHRTAASVGGADRIPAILAHLAAPIAAIVSVGWLNWAGPLVVWLLYKNHSPFVRTAAAQAFNYQITMWITSIIGWILVFTVVLSPIGLALILIGNVMALILGVWGALRTAGGHQYRYPWNLPFLK